MTLENAQGWLVLCVNSPLNDRLILSKEKIDNLLERNGEGFFGQMESLGYSPIADSMGNWVSFGLSSGIIPWSIPGPVQEILKEVIAGTVIIFDNGCLPSVEWRFLESEIQVVDTYDQKAMRTYKKARP